jgi:hypothetical protein
MSGSQDAERPSRSPRRTSFEEAKRSPRELQKVASSPQPFAHNALLLGMPGPERIRYSNKESAKVNAGLGYGGWHSHDQEVGLLYANKLVVDIDFSQLIAPVIRPEAKTTTETLACRLLHPPPHAFVHGILSMQWVIGAVGQKHIEFHDSDERYVLAKSSNLRKKGTVLGLPALYMEWLCGDNPELSANDQGVHLTPSFFNDSESQ